MSNRDTPATSRSLLAVLPDLGPRAATGIIVSVLIAGIAQIFLEDVVKSSPIFQWVSVVLLIAAILVVIKQARYYEYMRDTLLARALESRLSYAMESRRKLQCKVVENLQELEEINKVVRERFGEATVPESEVRKIYQANPRRSILMVEYTPTEPTRRVPRTVGFASAWPLRDEIGEQMKYGKLDETSLSSADILPVSASSSVTYIYITGIAINPPKQHSKGLSRLSADRLLILGLNFVDFLRTEFITDEQQRQLVMTAYSKAGMKMINRMAGHLPPSQRYWCDAKYNNADVKHCTLKVNNSDLNKIFELDLRFFAGLQDNLTVDRGRFWSEERLR